MNKSIPDLETLEKCVAINKELLESLTIYKNLLIPKSKMLPDAGVNLVGAIDALSEAIRLGAWYVLAYDPDFTLEEADVEGDKLYNHPHVILRHTLPPFRGAMRDNYSNIKVKNSAGTEIGRERRVTRNLPNKD